MRLFTPKATRDMQHATLIELAAAALGKLHVEIEDGCDGTRPHWTAATNEAVPLEFRRWIAAHLETLAKQARGVPEAEFGDRRLVDELAFALSAVRDFLAGLPWEVRQGLRGRTFADVQTRLAEQIRNASRALATHDFFFLFVAAADRRLEETMVSARTALAWFTDEDALAFAYALQEHPDHRLPWPNLRGLRRLAEEGGVVLMRLQATKAARRTRRR